MHIRDFELGELPRGAEQSAWLDVAARADVGNSRLSLLTVMGSEDEPTILAMASAPGDE